MKPPKKDVMSGILSVLEDHNLYLNQKTVEYTVAAFCHWLETTNRGKEYMAHVLKLSPHKGNHEYRYVYSDPNTSLTHELNPENIVFLEGCVSEGKPVPLKNLHIQLRDKEQCDNCGSQVICTQVVDGEKQCSYCLASSESQETRDEVKLNCSECNFKKCNWNPENPILLNPLGLPGR